MQASEFGKPASPERQRSFTFGIDKLVCAARLRQLASDIEEGVVAIQSAKVDSSSTLEDFTKTTLILEFCEQSVLSDAQKLVSVEQKLDGKLIKLWNNTGDFPIVVRKV